MVDLNRRLTPQMLAEMKPICEWLDDDITVADVITGQAGIGYGGHFDECSDEEHACHEIIALNDDELTEIHDARNEYVGLICAAVQAVEWPPSDDDPLRSGESPNTLGS